MAGGTATASFTGLARAAVFLSVATSAAGQETCTSVTVSGGDSPGVYERPTGSSYFVSSDDSTHVLQPVSFGATTARRNLERDDGGSTRRALANDCTSQIWILGDTATLEDGGFPYYTTFDCATHPASVESTWLYVDCEDCSTVADVTIICTASVSTDDVLSSGDGSGDGVFTLPVIIGIVAGALVFFLCLGFCFCQHRRRAHKGSQTFDDSTHSRISQKPGGAMFGGGAAASAAVSSVGGPAAANKNNNNAPPPAYITSAVGETVGSPIPLAASGAKGTSGDVGLLARGRDAGGSFKPNHNLPAFEGIFASRNGGGGGGESSQGGAGPKSGGGGTLAHPAAVEMAKYSNPEMLRKDSMAAAAAAASAASRSQGGGTGGGGGGSATELNDGFSSVLSSGVVEEGNFSQQPPPPRAQQQEQEESEDGGGGGITWTAGQNLNNHRRGYNDQPSESYGGDSAAGSVYDLQAPDDVEQHAYHQGYDDSVAASSPGAYSMYSHYTAGGGTYAGGAGGAGPGSELWSSDDGGSSRMGDRPVSRGYRGGGGGSGIGGAGGRGNAGGATIPSPAGLVARADWNSKRNMGGGGGGGGGGAGARGEDSQQRR